MAIDIDRKVSAEEAVTWVMTFIEASERLREPLLDVWHESLQNYFVQPYHSEPNRSRDGRAENPLYRFQAKRFDYAFGDTVLKDPESHQVVETYLAKLWSALFAERGYIQANPRGIEDAFAGDTVSRLLMYALNLPGHNRTSYEWLKDSLIFGTGLVELSWKYREDVRTIRAFDRDLEGNEVEVAFTGPDVIYDDPIIRHTPIEDFYPDPGNSRMENMLGVAKKFEVTARAAKDNRTWNQTAVRRAIENGAKAMVTDNQHEHDFVRGTDQMATLPEFHPMVGYEYWGEVPWKPNAGESRRRVLTVANGELVRDREWPLDEPRVPFYDITVNPVGGRFYGLGPLEAARYDQDFLDVMKRLIANASIRAIHPVPIYERSARPDLAKLKRFNPRVPIPVDNIGGITNLQYNPPVGDALGVYSTVKSQVREGTGALGAIQGLGLGSKRFSATEAAETFQQAFDRPEMMAMLIEKESLPPLGRGIQKLYSQFMADAEELAKRVGERPGSVQLADISGDFDIIFSGSRQQHSRTSKAQALERMIAVVGNIPAIAAMIPWEDVIAEYVEALDLPKIRAKIADPQVVQVNTILQQLLGASAGNGNGAGTALPPAGLNQAQTGGQALA